MKASLRLRIAAFFLAVLMQRSPFYQLGLLFTNCIFSSADDSQCSCSLLIAKAEKPLAFGL